MPISVPSLDDRGFDDWVRELLDRIPGHTPEWTHPALGDPGRTILELFAWLADALLYRVNRIPERQRLAFLKLLHIPLKPAVAARGLLVVEPSNPQRPDVFSVPVGTAVPGPVPFETTGEIMVLPLEGEPYLKRTPSAEEMKRLEDVIAGLESVYGLGATREAPGSVPYITTPLFPNRQADTGGVDIAAGSIDRCLWMALLAPPKADVAAVKRALSRDGAGPRILNVGWSPALKVPGILEVLGARAAVPHVWEITSCRRFPSGEPEYLTLDVAEDGTSALVQEGVLRLILPDADDMGTPENDVERDLLAGVGDRPPRLDDPEKASRLIAWVRLRPTRPLESLAVSWVGVNVVPIDQRRTLRHIVIGTSDGTADQEFQLPGTSVDPETLVVAVEDSADGFVVWRRTHDLNTSDRDDRAYALDAEAGIIRFGDGVRGRVPEAGMRLRVDTLRFGGGRKGNLPPMTLKAVSHPQCKAWQPLATSGGDDAETTAQAEKRIPETLRHQDRAVTEDDYRHLAAETPAVRVGRVEVLSRFKPQQRRFHVPGVVSVVVLPAKEDLVPPCPRPDRLTLERVHAYLDARRPVGTELYVIGVEYKPLAVAAAVRLQSGHLRDEVLQNVRHALQRFLWPLPPGGFSGSGWPLGTAVVDRDVETVIARVPGVRHVGEVRLFFLETDGWKPVAAVAEGKPAAFPLDPWQLPELLHAVCDEGDQAVAVFRSPLDGVPSEALAVPIPVVPEVC
uniref:Putative baseplate assembly protein n=1 Tax=Desulfacinum infernum TaxID=35837 RepID=A0A832A4G8_9BACT